MKNNIDIQNIYSLSPMQEGMLFHTIKDEKSFAYFEQISFWVDREIDHYILEKSLNMLIQRYDIFRAIFKYTNVKRPLQIILNERYSKIYYEDISNLDEEEKQSYLERYKQLDKEKGFDLTKDIPLRVSLFKTGEKTSYVVWSFHHIIMDGWCVEIVLKEFFQIYEALVQGKSINLRKVHPYGDYIKWLRAQNKEDALSYWKNYLDEYEIKTTLPKYAKSNGDLDFKPEEIKFVLDEDIIKSLSGIAVNNFVTVNTIFQVIWGIYLMQYNNVDDLVFGTVVSGRPAEVPGIETMIGLFVNTIPVRIKNSDGKSFSQLISEVQKSVIASEKYSYLSLSEIQEVCDLKQVMFDHLISFRVSIEQDSDSFRKKFGIRGIKYFEQTNFDFYIVVAAGKEWVIKLKYNSNVIEKNFINKVEGHLKEIIRQVTENPDIPISNINILTPEERKLILFDFNNTKMDYPDMATITELFEKQVEKTPDNDAVIFENQSITYKELNEKANQLAWKLRKTGVKSETVVGVLMERSIDAIIALIAILKAGGAYLPIDPELPKDRVLYMLQDSGAKVLLTNSYDVKDIPFTLLRNFESNNDIEIVLTKPRNPIMEFDKLPMPDRSFIILKNYKDKIGMASVENVISIQATRGCPYKCIFCHKVWSKTHVYRSAENIFNEILYYYKQGVNKFEFIDDCFNLNYENSSRLFKMIIQNGLKLQIYFPNGLRGDLLTHDYIDLMVEAGVCNINLSLETASPRLQELIKKNLDLDKFKDAICYIASKYPNVILELATMHGFPTETEEEALMTLDFIKSIKWIHFPYIHILKIFPNTEMEALALESGISKEDIFASKDLAYHELPETLPFTKNFTRKYQANFMNEYFLSKERLKHVLPNQIKLLSEDAIIQKYNAYLPAEIKSIEDILKLAGIEDLELERHDCSVIDTAGAYFDREVPKKEPKHGAKKILLLDLSMYFSSSEEEMLYNVSEQPLGLIYLLTYLKQEFGDKIDGRIYKSQNDFDSYEELKALIDEYKPDLIGIRTLTFFKEFLHETVALIRQWGVECPVIVGGPYATSDYDTILKDRHIDLVVLGEGEYTFAELIRKMFENNFQIPNDEVLNTINGIAFAKSDENKDKSVEIIYFDQIRNSLMAENTRNPGQLSKGSNLAYVMYTSGSTGKPKGVMVEHRQVNNCISWMQNYFRLTSKDTIVQRTNLGFDPSVWEIFWPLYIGARVMVISRYQSKDAGYLLKLMECGDKVTMMYCPASLVNAMVYLMESLGRKTTLNMPWLIIGAEPISMETVKKLYSCYSGNIVNTYGPTECTINNTYYHIYPDDTRTIVPIGRNVANNYIYILGKNLQPMPIGVPGEITIAGASVARGYINNREKTEESFIDNPLGEGKLYKTGDIGRWLEDGNIEILGRMDEQVKIRGYRIELNEIKAAIMKDTNVKDCIVAVRDSNKHNAETRVCKVCGITSKYPGARINNENNCEICQDITEYKAYISKYFKTLDDLKKLIIEKNKEKKSKYDCLLLYSGGRGAAYALYTLVDMGFNVLAATYDHGYYSEADLKNIEKITSKLGVDHIILRHKNTNEILRESMKVAKTVCKGCFYTSSSLALEYAYKNNINVVIGATLSRGQIIENKLYMFYKQEITDVHEIEKELANLQKSLPDLEKSIYDLIDIDVIKDRTVYDNVCSVDFYRYCEIMNEEMINYLNNRDPYWKKRKNYSIYSTNCPIKQIGDCYHLKETGYHYYGSATSWEKRLGHLTLENVKEDLKCRVSYKAVENFMRIINYTKENDSEKIDTRYLCAYIIGPKDMSIEAIKGRLSKMLPKYMVPSHYVILDKFPYTHSGKIDMNALPEPEISTINKVEYVPPRNEIEAKLIEVFSKVFGVDGIGMKDDFFDLGGDSIKSIQVIAQLNKYGLKLDIKDIFENPIIEEMCKCIKIDNTVRSNESVKGEVELTPIQKRFFEKKFDEMNHYNQSVMLFSRKGFDEDYIKKVFTKLIEHHDALRMTYLIKDDTVIQQIRDIDSELFSINVMNLYDSENYEEIIEAEADKIQRSIDLTNGPLVKIGLFKTTEGDHLLIVIHHLVIDGVSWRILFEDFITAYTQVMSGNDIALPNKTDSFALWPQKLHEYAISYELKKELDYWNNITKTNLPKIKKDYAIDSNKVADTVSYKFELTEEETCNILKNANKAYNTETRDILITALGMALTEWTGNDKILIDMEGHGRENIIPGIDISRTIGWFTTIYPFVISFDRSKNLSYNIKSVKESIRRIPDNGIGFGILKYITRFNQDIEIDFLHEPEIIFNYLGQFDQDINTQLFSLSNLSKGSSVSSDMERYHSIEINGMIIGGRLRMTFSYNKYEFKESTIGQVAERYKKCILEIVNHCMGKDDIELTPTDLGDKELSLEELDDIQSILTE